MTGRVLGLVLLFVAACAPRAVEQIPPSSQASAPPLAASVEPTIAPTATPVPATPAPTPEPRPLFRREIAGIEFGIAAAGPAELRIDTALAREDEALVVKTVESDIPAVEREFERSFAGRPVIYVYASTAGYTEGFVRIFGYGRTTAAFVAENSVSFFEPSLRLIAVNWEAIRERRPIAAIRHELTHLLTLDACAPRCDLVPAWLNEGQARLAEALIPGGDWRLVRVRYEAASMAASGTLIPLNTLVSQLGWNSLTEWAGYFKYQEAARAVELLREDVGGDAPIARVYERLRRGQNLAQAYSALTGRSFDDFVAGLPERMSGILPAGPGFIAVDQGGPGSSYLLYKFAPSSTVLITVSGPRGTESWPMVVSPFGSSFDGLPSTRTSGGYTISAQDGGAVLTIKIKKLGEGAAGDSR